MVFVFGSNLSGIHGAGAAKVALKYHGAIWGIGEGYEGNSYALPTVGINLNKMPIEAVIGHINKFKSFAESNPNLTFKVTCVGCGLAGFTDEEIAPHFIGSPSNCFFDTKWRLILGNEPEYWGTYPKQE